MNDHIKVKLTKVGFEIWKKDRDELVEWSKGVLESQPIEYFTSQADSDGNHKFQLWELMRIFGPYIGPCLPMPFSPVMIMETKP